MTAAEAERVHEVEWKGEDVTLDDVLAQLTRLRAELVVPDPHDYNLPHARNSVMNLVAVAGSEESVRRAATTGEELGAQHPSRTIIINPDPAGDSRIDASIRTHAHNLVAGVPVQYEEIQLTVHGDPANYLYSLVEPFLLPDVRTHLWWLGTPLWESETFREVLPYVDTLVVDSGHFERPYASFLALARVEDTMHEPQAVADFQWSRLKPWREAVAQVFAPHDRRAFLFGVTSIELDYTGRDRGNRVRAALLAGWLIRSLKLRLRNVVTDENGGARAIYRYPGGGEVLVSERSVDDRQSGPGRVGAVRIEALAHGRRCRLELSRDPAELERAVLSLIIDGTHVLRHDVRLYLATAPDSVLMSDVLLWGRRDPVYLSSMTAAAGFLSAFD